MKESREVNKAQNEISIEEKWKVKQREDNMNKEEKLDH